ncbi:SusD/RagB family nutrient-binding outer membrane lipoprotein [Flexithrix dorotheae]|uniref:SusD/RagB family nutrient-binding outer membrane lipoprotein n=1 Tax=Flexithrix dorotheae TaxID=70993 RepID=UPI00146B6742|nr:SusD/RagB family nutrient-binding outer membrane lipoprotein [Flexithrix dorotheae]
MKSILFKNKFLVVTLIIIMLTSTACEDELTEINENPNEITNLDYGIQLTNILLSTTEGGYEMFRASLGYCFASIQQLADLESPVSGVFLPGDKYLNDPLFAASLFDEVYTREHKNLADFLHRTKDDEEAVNYHAMGRIWRVMSAHRITDIYGDVPYFNSGKGYIDNNWFPAYDAQEEIYADMLNELEGAVLQLDPNKKNPGTNDIIYNGDLDKWKKLAYSLMLRLGMRLTKVDNGAAEVWVKKAISGGVMTSNDDIAKIIHEIGASRNPFFNGFETRDQVRLSATFVDWMINMNDPRLDMISYVESGGPHKGLPNGYDYETIQDYPGGNDLTTYSNYNPELRKWESPSFRQTYAEVELLLAEAAVYSWHGGDAAEHYEKGVRAAINQFGLFGVELPSDSAIDDYLNNNPFDPAKGLEMIGEQYWAATILVSWEGYSNWRRTGFPVLTPTNYPGNVTNGQILRRLTYSGTEYSLNAENVNAANNRQGPDDFMTRVWWDKE